MNRNTTINHMNTTINHNEPPEADFVALVAIDWADQAHAFSLLAAGQSRKETGTLEQKPEIVGRWLAQLRERFGGRPIAVALEQSRGTLIHALLEYDFVVVYPIHPATVAHFRQAFKFSGAKSDLLDTDQILEILAKHRSLLQPLNPDTAQTRLLGRRVQDRHKTVDLRTSHLQALRASLKEYFPQALEILSGNVSSRLAHDFLYKWPDFPAFPQARPQRRQTLLLWPQRAQCQSHCPGAEHRAAFPALDHRCGHRRKRRALEPDALPSHPDTQPAHRRL